MSRPSAIPYGGYTKAVAGPYGGRVTTTLPAGYRTTVYHGRSYYHYGGVYYRPYTYHGVHHYYPVPVPYYAYYPAPPVGAIIIMVAGISYMMAKDGTYSKQTTSSDGKVVYQSVPPPQGASIKTLPVERVLVTVSGTTYYLSANAFYRRVMSGSQESFVCVTPPAGTVFVAALPADFEVVQLNTMYFLGEGAVLRALPVGGRQGNVRDGGPAAATAGPSRSRGRCAGSQRAPPVSRPLARPPRRPRAGGPRREGIVHGRRRNSARRPARR